ncbi:BhlA/UviB family holin-like peptide [Hathewaya histolytica]|uniref:Bacteriocin UviB n=1 Tax=Hathewaya histolytica TaxID=1498 RepID=A0A4V6Z1E4_HATHI|nr:BhlA/UviB family holin-like peptide [Hathewaya histolytica]VTQ93727.1 bacteriocin UviB [Hathewaya histolytica]
MENQILKYLLTQGAFAGLFTYLLFYVLKENSNRENNYQNIIQKLTDKFNLLDDVSKKVDKIKETLDK